MLKSLINQHNNTRHFPHLTVSAVIRHFIQRGLAASDPLAAFEPLPASPTKAINPAVQPTLDATIARLAAQYGASALPPAPADEASDGTAPTHDFLSMDWIDPLALHAIQEDSSLRNFYDTEELRRLRQQPMPKFPRKKQ